MNLHRRRACRTFPAGQTVVRLLLCLPLLVTAAQVLAADALAQLHRFVAQTQSAKGEFEQSATMMSSDRLQHARGDFAFARPGRFQWRYQEPYRQELLGDGERLWSWDPDLNQVTVRPLDGVLGATPAAILFGEDDLELGFELSDDGEADGLAWVEAVPRTADSGFESLRIGFAEGELRMMEIRDSFGQRTRIRFFNIIANPAFEDGHFRFEPPAGADVIGVEAGAAAGQP